MLFPAARQGVRVLVYHSISEVPRDADCKRITTPQRLFKWQVEYLLCKGYNIIPADELLAYLSGAKKITGKEILLTFDDGFEDNLLPVKEALSNRSLNALFFLSPDFFNRSLMPHLAKLTYLQSKPLSRQGVLSLLADGMTIGSHGLKHADLGSLLQQDQRLRDEICRSKNMLEKELGREILYFAYPYGCRGSFNAASEKIIRESGYKAAFTNIMGVNKSGDNIFTLKRTRVSWLDTPFRFRMKLKGAYDWVDSIAGFFKDELRR